MLNSNGVAAGRRILLIMVAASLLAACGARLTAEERLARAETSLSQGDSAAAAIHLRNVLQQDPTNVQARILLAEAALRGGDFDTAAKEFQRAVDLGAEPGEIRLSFVEALVRVGAFDQALRLLEPEEELEDSPPLAYWHSRALLGKGRFAESRGILESLRADAELGDRAQIGLARIALSEQQAEVALGLLELVPEKARESSDYWEVLAFAAANHGDHETAARAFGRAAQTVVDAVGTHRLGLLGGEIESLLALGRLDEARRKATTLHSQAEQHPLTNYLMARVELQAGNPRQALAHGQAMLATQPDASVAHMMVGAAHLALEQPTQAERHLERAVAAAPGNVNARRLLAQLRLGLQSPERALEALGPMATDVTDPGMAVLAGVASVRAGDVEAAVSIFRRQLEQDPGNDEARSMLAVSLMTAGRVDEALAELAQISDADAAVRQRADLIEVSAYLQGGSPAEARDRAGALAQAQPGNANLRTVLGGLFLSAGQADDARAWFEAGLALDPANVAANFNLGRIEAAAGNLEAARAHFAGVIESSPDNSAALAALGQLDWFEGNRDSAVAYLERARAANSRDANSRVLLANYLGLMDRRDEARAAAREAVEIAPGSAPAHDVLGRTYLGVDAGNALASFREAHRIQPTEPAYLVNMARAEVTRGELEAARGHLVNALALDPESQPALFALVDVERRRGQVVAARQAFARLERAAPANAAGVEQLRGELLLAEGEAAAAERAFRLALEGGIGARAAVGIYEARRRGSPGDPAEPLQAWLSERPADAAVRTLLADHHLVQGDHPGAIREYERLVADAPDNPAFLNNLAWLLSQAGDARARGLARRARELAPDSPMVADTLGWILYQEGDTEGALALIREAAAAAPRVGEIQYHLAVLLAETGDAAGARAAARRVLAEPAAANYHEPAQALLERIGRGEE